MKRRFAYLFSVAGRIHWSSETEESLMKRVESDSFNTKTSVQAFIWDSVPGQFITLETGEFIFRTE